MAPLIADILRAFSTGFLVCIPIGPVGLLTMHRSAVYGWRAGFISILPAFTVDAAAAFLFLLDSPVTFFRHHHFPHWFGIFGAIILLLYGIIMYRQASIPPKHHHIPWQQNFFSSLAVALTNPSAYVGYAAIAVLLSRYTVLPVSNRIGIAIAYCIGALVWWLMVITIASVQQNHTKSKVVMQRVASIIMMAAAVVMVFPPHHFFALVKEISQRL